MGTVLVTVDAFQEKKYASEITDLLLIRGVKSTYQIFDKYPGVIVFRSDEVNSIDLSKIMLSIAHVRRIVKSVVPLVWSSYGEFRSYEDIAVLIIEDFLPRIDIEMFNSKKVVVRCRFRGLKGEHRVEMIVGAYLKRLVNFRVSFEDPDYLILIEQVGELCGVYVGHPDKNILMYRPYTC